MYSSSESIDDSGADKQVSHQEKNSKTYHLTSIMYTYSKIEHLLNSARYVISQQFDNSPVLT